LFLGYTPTTLWEGCSWAMAGFVDDSGIAHMAEGLAKDPSDPRHVEYAENAEYFRARALDYVNQFDATVGFFQGRNLDGSFRYGGTGYTPLYWGQDYTETDGWTMAFAVPHDVNGLANLYGGAAALAQKLDAYFATPELADHPGGYGQA